MRAASWTTVVSFLRLSSGSAPISFLMCFIGVSNGKLRPAVQDPSFWLRRLMNSSESGCRRFAEAVTAQRSASRVALRGVIVDPCFVGAGYRTCSAAECGASTERQGIAIQTVLARRVIDVGASVDRWRLDVTRQR